MMLIRRMGTCFLLCALFAGFIYVIDPRNEGFGMVQYPVLKYLPFALALLSCCVYLLTLKLSIDKIGLPLLLFVLFSILGALYALLFFQQPLEETYLGRSLGGLVLIGCFMLGQSLNETRFFVRYFFLILLLAAFTMEVIVILYRLGVVYQDLVQIYQARVIILAAACMLSLHFFSSKKIQQGTFLLFLIGIILVAKTTAYLVASLIIVYCSLMYLRRMKNKQGTHNKIGFYGVIASLTVAIAVIFLFSINELIEARFEDRGYNLRYVTMVIRIDSFFASPLYGSGFTGSPLVDFGPLHIPSHSDVIDLIAFGGLISIMLFFVPVYKLLIASIVKNNTYNLRNLLGFILLIYFCIMMVNPVLSIPGLAFMFWMSIGLLAGMSLQKGLVNHHKTVI